MQPTIHRHSFSRTGARWALGSLLGLGALFAQTASASALGDAIRQLGASDGLQRSVTPGAGHCRPGRAGRHGHPGLLPARAARPASGRCQHRLRWPLPEGRAGDLDRGDLAQRYAGRIPDRAGRRRHAAAQPARGPACARQRLRAPGRELAQPQQQPAALRRKPLPRQLADHLAADTPELPRGPARCAHHRGCLEHPARAHHRAGVGQAAGAGLVRQRLAHRCQPAAQQQAHAGTGPSCRGRGDRPARPGGSRRPGRRARLCRAAGAEPQHKLASDAELGALLMLGPPRSAATSWWPTRHCSSA